MLYTCFVFAGMRSHGSVADTDGVTRVVPHEMRPDPELQHHLACLPAALLAASFTTRARNDGSIWLGVADVGPTWSGSRLKVSSYHINNGLFILKRESHLTDDWFSTLANVIFFNFPNLLQAFPKAPRTLLAQFSLYVHKGGLKPDSFHFLERCSHSPKVIRARKSFSRSFKMFKFPAALWRPWHLTKKPKQLLLPQIFTKLW